MEPSSPWKRPDEVMQLHRLKKRKRALQERMKHPQSQKSEDNSSNKESADLDFSRLLNGEKRRNPFSKNNGQADKKLKSDNVMQLDESNDKTLFALMKLPSKRVNSPPKDVNSDKLATFSNLLQKYNADHTVEPLPEKKYKYLPIDWALKTKVRLMSPKPFAWSQQLKASEEASGITGFVRCMDTSSSPSVDTSPRARFHQACLYWQHPHLPWLQLFPRARKAAVAGAFVASEEMRHALYNDWTESFRSLFQLLRARHCPYFYVCANTFTCLFRAGGVCGRGEPVALVTPTTRGLRQALRQEDVEFTMPLRSESKRKLNNSDSKDGEKPKNSSYDSCYDTMDETKSLVDQNTSCNKDEGGSADEEDLDSDNFLSQMGFGADDIRRINNCQARAQSSAESVADSAAQSLVVAEGAEAQALFNFLLNCRSLVAGVGACAGVPPTLLAPVAFHGATLQPLKVRESSIMVEGTRYHSMEVRGPVLPSALHALLGGVRAAATCASATFAHHAASRAFCWAAGPMAADDRAKGGELNHFTKAFNEENLSDCGMSEQMLRHFCCSDPSMVQCIDSVKYNAEDDTYTW